MRPATEQRPVGVVLAGGLSSRLGVDKAVLRLGPGDGGPSLLQWSVERLQQLGCDVVVAAGPPHSARLRRLRAAVDSADELTWVFDAVGRGPAAGIVAATAARQGRGLLVLGCDLPRIPVAVLSLLLEHGERSPADWIVPRGSRGLEPMAALYGPTLLQRLRRRVDRQQLALHALAHEPDLRVIELGPETFAAFGELDHLFLNVNTPEDLRRLRLSGGS